MKMSRATSQPVCSQCYSKKKTRKDFPHPLWLDETKTPHYTVPEELSGLSEGEKLLIQQVSPFIPLQHLQNGSYGMKGHVCSFPQDISEICTQLPRLPKDVKTITIVKGFVTDDGDNQKISFKIRKEKVLAALCWLKKYNIEYKDIEIVEENLGWMQNDTENLPNKTSLSIDSDDNSPKAMMKQSLEDNDIPASTDAYVYGYLTPPPNENLPQAKDKEITDALRNSFQKSNTNTSIDFPYVSELPVNEYDSTIKLFTKAFPWLYPGGVGDYNDYTDTTEDIDTWLERLVHYFDGRFAQDKMWCFFALNYANRRKNSTAGSYFVKNFYKNGPKSLSQLQNDLEKGDFEWIDRIQYYSHKVKGSSGYWRFKRSEVYSWINHHVNVGNGPPSLFITLSCAEYYWPDIKRLLNERLSIAGVDTSDQSTRQFFQNTNDYTLVVQEYFQQRVSLWLQTVGKQVFKINHHWLRYEFAPGRGQIHAHMLAITDHLVELSKSYQLQEEDKRVKDSNRNQTSEQAKFIMDWVNTSFKLTSMVHPELIQLVKSSTNMNHPSTEYYTNNADKDIDVASCQFHLQRHECTEKCMQKRRHW